LGCCLALLGWKKRNRIEETRESLDHRNNASDTVTRKSKTKDENSYQSDSLVVQQLDNENTDETSSSAKNVDSLFSDEQKNPNQDASEDCLFRFMDKAVFFSTPIFDIVDYVSDITVMVRFFWCSSTVTLGFISLAIIVIHRFVSAVVQGDHDGWKVGLRQLLDIQKTFVVINKRKGKEYKQAKVELREYKVLDGILENLPQLLLQTYYLIEYGAVDSMNDKACGNSKDLLVYISIALSLMSLSRCYVYSDMASISGSGLMWRYTRLKNLNRLDEQAWRSPSKVSKFWCLLLLLVWRFGEIAMKVCTLAAFAKVVSARGSFACILMLIPMYGVKLHWKESGRASMFYRAKKKRKMKEFLLKGTHGEDEEKSQPIMLGDISPRHFFFDNQETFKQVDLDLVESEESIRNSLSYRSQSICLNTFTQQIIERLFWVLELIYYFLALPTLYPRALVIFYYGIMLLFETGLLLACYVEILKEVDYHNPSEILRNEVFGDLFIYWGVGVVCFFAGGILVFLFVIDVQVYKQIVEADLGYLLYNVKKKDTAHITLEMRNGLCSFYDILRQAYAKMKETHFDYTNESDTYNFMRGLPHCQLLYFMIKEKLIPLGRGPKEPKDPECYSKCAIPALLHCCNDSIFKTYESQFAKIFLLELVKTGKFTFQDLYRAGVSLTFLRYHLHRGGGWFRTHCTAKELCREHFDRKFCLDAGFSEYELKKAEDELKTQGLGSS